MTDIDADENANASPEDKVEATPAPPKKASVFSRLYHGETDFNIVGRWKLWFGVSGVIILVGVGALVVNGLNFGIDFTGGTVWEVPAGKADVAEVTKAVAALGYDDVQVQETVEVTDQGRERRLRVEAAANASPTPKTTKALDAARADLADAAASVKGSSQTRLNQVASQLDGVEGPFPDDVPEDLQGLQQELNGFAKGLKSAEDPTAYVKTTAATMQAQVEALTALEQSYREEVGRNVSDVLAEQTGAKVSDVAVDTVGPSWGQQISEKARQALIVFLIVITLYITLRFEFRMAVATLVALVHDLLIVVGIYALFQFPVTPATVIAVLTILGFSIYDGIVVFDRVDENTKLLGRRSKMTYTDMANRSLNQVLMRSLNTSITALLPIIAVLVLGAFVLGATTLEEFGLALFLGLLSGAYSSIFIATPLLAVLKEREPRYRELRERNQGRNAGRSGGAIDDEAGDAPTDPDAVIEPKPRKQGRTR